MKTYKFGDGNFYSLVIESDDGIKVADVCGDKIIEYDAKEYDCKGGIIRLEYGNGSSLPYKNADGTINEKYTLISEK